MCIICYLTVCICIAFVHMFTKIKVYMLVYFVYMLVSLDLRICVCTGMCFVCIYWCFRGCLQSVSLRGLDGTYAELVYLLV